MFKSFIYCIVSSAGRACLFLPSPPEVFCMKHKSRLCCLCNFKIPWRVTIDGATRLLINRKHCLACVPFKTRYSKYGLHFVSSYTTWPEAKKALHRKRTAEKGSNRKSQLISLAGGKCLKCNYVGTPRTMTFHHRDPSVKSFGLDQASMRSKNWTLVLQEFTKCDLLCIRCHYELEDILRAASISGDARDS